MLKARWIGPRWMKALVKMRHHSPAATAKALMRFALADRPDPAAEEAAAQRLALRQDRVDDEEHDADGDDRVGHERDVRGVGAARAVELAPGGEVVTRLLQEPRDAVGDRAALGGRRAAVRLAIGLDRAVEVTVADELLGHAAPAEPRASTTSRGRGAPGVEGAGLVIGPVASGPDDQPRLAGDVGVGMPGQGVGDRGSPRRGHRRRGACEPRRGAGSGRQPSPRIMREMETTAERLAPRRSLPHPWQGRRPA